MIHIGTKKRRGISGCEFIFQEGQAAVEVFNKHTLSVHKSIRHASVGGARNASARCSRRRISTAAPAFLLAVSATGGARKRLPPTSLRSVGKEHDYQLRCRQLELKEKANEKSHPVGWLLGGKEVIRIG